MPYFVWLLCGATIIRMAGLIFLWQMIRLQISYLKNNGDGTFAEEALVSGVAYSGEGVEQGCMGAAYADFNRDGRYDLVVTNFADENNAFYVNDRNGLFLRFLLR